MAEKVAIFAQTFVFVDIASGDELGIEFFAAARAVLDRCGEAAVIHIWAGNFHALPIFKKSLMWLDACIKHSTLVTGLGFYSRLVRQSPHNRLRLALADEGLYGSVELPQKIRGRSLPRLMHSSQFVAL